MNKLWNVLAVALVFLSACNSKTTGSAGTVDSAAVKTERNKAVALSTVDGFKTHDIDKVTSGFAANFTEYNNGEGKPITNIDSLKSNLKGMLELIPDFKVDHPEAVASGDTVLVTGTWSGTFKSSVMGVKTNGKAMKYNDVDVFIFDKDGKIISHRSIQANASALLQSGITIPGSK